MNDLHAADFKRLSFHGHEHTKNLNNSLGDITVKNLLLLSFLLLMLTGCATEVRYTMPATLFETPEVSGEFLKGDIGLGAATGVEYVTVKDVRAIPPRSSGSRISGTSSEIAFRLGLGVGNRFEISYSTPFVLAKWQYLGSNRLAAQSEQWLGAVMAGYAKYHNQDTSSDLLSDGLTNKDRSCEERATILSCSWTSPTTAFI